MGTGIILCGLNGAGKSTLGKALAQHLNFHYIDNEELYFPKTDPGYTYASPRTKEEVKVLLKEEIKAHENFIFTSVIGNYGESIYPYFQYAILIEVPKNIRVQRVKNRSFQKFGKRMLPGGDLYEQEEAFFQFIQSRTGQAVEDWVHSLSCPVIRVDGTKPIEENILLLTKRIKV